MSSFFCTSCLSYTWIHAKLFDIFCWFLASYRCCFFSWLEGIYHCLSISGISFTVFYWILRNMNINKKKKRLLLGIRMCLIKTLPNKIHLMKKSVITKKSTHILIVHSEKEKKVHIIVKCFNYNMPLNVLGWACL